MEQINDVYVIYMNSEKSVLELYAKVGKFIQLLPIYFDNKISWYFSFIEI